MTAQFPHVPDSGSIRLLMTCDAVGGVWQYALRLSQALGPHGCQVTLVSMGPRPSPVQQLEAADIPNIDLVMTDCTLDWMDPAFKGAEHAAETLQGIAAESEADLFHSNGFRDAALPWQIPVLLTAHSCVFTWWRACRDSRPPAEWQRYGASVRRALTSAAHVVTPTAAFGRALTDAYGLDRTVTTIWNGAAPLTSPEPKEPFILAAGRLWDEAKGVPALLAAAEGLSWPVRLAGDEGDGAPTREENRNTEYLGHLPQEQLHALMARAEIFVSPALYEPFGLAALEAASLGSALVLSDIPGFRELWDGAALFFPPGDTGALHRALYTLSRDDVARQRLQHNARTRAARYSGERMANAYAAAYQNLLARHTPATELARTAS